MSDALIICEKVLASKKYSMLYSPLVLRVCEGECKKHPKKEQLKAVKSSLHTIYGAYGFGEIHKKANRLLDSLGSWQSEQNKSGLALQKDIFERVLSLHASTRERMTYLTEFYGFIFEHIGSVESVLDIGCGFNPFTIPWFPVKGLEKYYALDIDKATAELNNRLFGLLGKPLLASCVDIVIETPPTAVEAAFLFKLLPVIERQAKGRCIQLLNEINAKFLVITYPTKSLSGKEKGMQEFYSATFEGMISSATPAFRLVAKREIGNELVYILSKSRSYM